MSDLGFVNDAFSGLADGKHASVELLEDVLGVFGRRDNAFLLF